MGPSRVTSNAKDESPARTEEPKELEPRGHPGRVRGERQKNPRKDSQAGPQAVYLSQECLGKNAACELSAPNQMKLRVFRNSPLGGPAELAPA